MILTIIKRLSDQGNRIRVIAWLVAPPLAVVFSPSTMQAQTAWCSWDRNEWTECTSRSSGRDRPEPEPLTPYSLPAFNQALADISRGRYDLAISALELASRTLPNNSLISEKLAEAKKLDSAERARQINEAAVALHNAGNYAAAIEEFKRAAETYTERRDLYLQHASISQRVWDGQKAKEARAAELNRRVEELRRQNLNDRTEQRRKENLLMRAARAEEERRLEELKVAGERDQAQAIMRGIQRINVPPPIPPGAVQIAFGQLPSAHRGRDEKLERMAGAILFGGQLVGKISGGPLLMTNVIVIAAAAVIAGLDGADVYVTRETAVYEKALAYLEDPATHNQFVALVRQLKERRSPSENTSVDMLRAAQAITDPKLGAVSTTLKWDALMSPEATNAAMTRFGIEAVMFGVAAATGRAMKLDVKSRNRAYYEAIDFLDHAKVALKKTTDPVALASLEEAIAQANRTIVLVYTAPSTILQEIETRFARPHAEQGREIPQLKQSEEGNKR